MSKPTSKEAHVLIGATGYVGQFLAQRLIELLSDTNCEWHGHRLVLTYGSHEPPASVRDAVPKFVTFLCYVADDEAPDALRDALDALNVTVDVVFNTAAVSSPGVCEKEPAKSRAINELRGIVRVPRRRLVHLSSDQVFDGTPLDHAPYTPASPLSPPTAYGEQKVAAERAIREATQNGVVSSHVILRPSVIIGARASFIAGVAHDTFAHWVVSQLEARTAFDAFANEMRTFTYVGDLVRWLIAAAQLPDGTPPVAQTLHAGGADRLSRHGLAVALAQQMAVDAALVKPVVIDAKMRAAFAYPRPPDLTMDSSETYRLLKHAATPLERYIDEIVPIGASAKKRKVE